MTLATREGERRERTTHVDFDRFFLLSDDPLYPSGCSCGSDSNCKLYILNINRIT